ncbi:MAG: hypothetical protein Q8R04_00295 [Nanoarchaeota archaeon]|nr:hypothetical protein [Nanoarchaeota archaeon]
MLQKTIYRLLIPLGGIAYLLVSFILLKPFIKEISGAPVIFFAIGLFFFIMGIVLLSSIFIRRLI